MAQKKPYNDNFADLVARLNAMSNITPEQESASLMEATKSEPKVLDDKDISLADIARLAGIKEYTEAPKVSKKAKKLVEDIEKTDNETVVEKSDIAKGIAESDADDRIAERERQERQAPLLRNPRWAAPQVLQLRGSLLRRLFPLRGWALWPPLKVRPMHQLLRVTKVLHSPRGWWLVLPLTFLPFAVHGCGITHDAQLARYRIERVVLMPKCLPLVRLLGICPFFFDSQFCIFPSLLKGLGIENRFCAISLRDRISHLSWDTRHRGVVD